MPAFAKKVKSGYKPEPKRHRQKAQTEEEINNPYVNIKFCKVYEDFRDTVLANTYKSRNNRDTLINMLDNHVLPVIGQYPIKDTSEKLSAASKRKIVGYMNKI